MAALSHIPKLLCTADANWKTLCQEMADARRTFELCGEITNKSEREFILHFCETRHYDIMLQASAIRFIPVYPP